MVTANIHLKNKKKWPELNCILNFKIVSKLKEFMKYYTTFILLLDIDKNYI